MSGRCDFIVTGAGILGASPAACLAESGSVLVAESEAQPGFHATGRSSALCAPGHGDGLTPTITQRSRPQFDAGDLDGRPFLKHRGELFLATVGREVSWNAAHGRNTQMAAPLRFADSNLQSQVSSDRLIADPGGHPWN